MLVASKRWLSSVVDARRCLQSCSLVARSDLQCRLSFTRVPGGISGHPETPATSFKMHSQTREMWTEIGLTISLD